MQTLKNRSKHLYIYIICSVARGYNRQTCSRPTFQFKNCRSWNAITAELPKSRLNSCAKHIVRYFLEEDLCFSRLMLDKSVSSQPLWGIRMSPRLRSNRHCVKNSKSKGASLSLSLLLSRYKKLYTLGAANNYPSYSAYYLRPSRRAFERVRWGKKPLRANTLNIFACRPLSGDVRKFLLDSSARPARLGALSAPRCALALRQIARALDTARADTNMLSNGI